MTNMVRIGTALFLAMSGIFGAFAAVDNILSWPI